MTLAELFFSLFIVFLICDNPSIAVIKQAVLYHFFILTPAKTLKQHKPTKPYTNVFSQSLNVIKISSIIITIPTNQTP